MMMRTPRNGFIEHYQKRSRQIARRAKTLLPVLIPAENNNIRASREMDILDADKSHRDRMGLLKEEEKTPRLSSTPFV